MFEDGLFGGMFDFNNDGELDAVERATEFGAFMDLVGEDEDDDSSDSDIADAPEDILQNAGIDTFDFDFMDYDEKLEALEDAGLDPDDFDL